MFIREVCILYRTYGTPFADEGLVNGSPCIKLTSFFPFKRYACFRLSNEKCRIPFIIILPLDPNRLVCNKIAGANLSGSDIDCVSEA